MGIYVDRLFLTMLRFYLIAINEGDQETVIKLGNWMQEKINVILALRD